MINQVFINYTKKGWKIFIIGPYPPPIGGVSVHVSRFIKQLESLKIHYELLNLSNISKKKKYFLFLKILFKPKKYIFYINSADRYLRLILLFRLLPSKIIFYDHNFRFLDELNSFWTFLFTLFLRKTNEYWIVNSNQINYYNQYCNNLQKKIKVINPFIPPVLSEESRIINSYNKSLFEFIDLRNPLIIGNAYRLVFHNDIDTYGFDLLIKLICQLKSDIPNIGLILALADEKYNEKYLISLKKMIFYCKIEQNIYFLTGQKILWPLFKYAKLFIRPTATDGDPLSIREANYFNVPVIASDVCERPAYVQLFKSRDIDDLVIKSKNILKQK